MFCFNTQKYEYKYVLPTPSIPNGIPPTTSTGDLVNKAISTPLTPRRGRSFSELDRNTNKRFTVAQSPISFTPPLTQEDLTDHNYEAIAQKRKTSQENKNGQTSMNNTPKIQNSNKNGEPLKFERVDVLTEITNESEKRSLLTIDLKPTLNNSPSTKRSVPKSTNQLSPRNELVAVLVPHKYGGVHRIALDLSQYPSLYVKDLVPLALDLYRKQTGLEPVIDNTQTYFVRTAEEDHVLDGTILDGTILVRPGMKLAITFERSQPLMVTPQSLPYLTDLRLKVQIPPSKHEHLVPIHPDLLLRDLCKVLCTRFCMDHTKYSVNIVLKDGKHKALHKSMRERTMGSLKTITKVAIVRSGDEEITESATSPTLGSPNQAYTHAPRSMSFQEEVLPFDLDAMQYREYRVIKTNKFGSRQERLLGIDADLLYNRKPSANAKSVFGWYTSGKTTKHPERKIDTLAQVIPNYDKNNPRTFGLKFNDGSVLSYEAKTQVECDGIIKKLTYLMQLKKQEVGSELFKRKSVIIRTTMLGDLKGL
jgi:hypothetical protein